MNNVILYRIGFKGMFSIFNMANFDKDVFTGTEGTTVGTSGT